MNGLLLPSLTRADPSEIGEGTLDPLGLASLADLLADEIAPEVTARMRRVRFVTAMAASAVVTQGLEDHARTEGAPTPSIAFEWYVVSALGRSGDLPPRATAATPGIQKARAALVARRPLDASTYLKAPGVFGFHGVYKRLARAMRVVDDDLTLAEQGDLLVRVWEREEMLDGFSALTAGTEGGNFARLLHDNVRRALEGGVAAVPTGSYVWGWLARTLRPDLPGAEERELLHAWLGSEEYPVRREVVGHLDALDRDAGSEEAVLGWMRARAGRDLRPRIDAIAAYERVARLLLDAFDELRHLSTARGLDPVPFTTAGATDLLQTAADELPDAIAHAHEHVDPLAADRLERSVGDFAEPRSGDELARLLLEHHASVQAAKPPGKRSWFEVTDDGFVVRPISTFRLVEPPGERSDYVHPYRITALRSLLADVT